MMLSIFLTCFVALTIGSVLLVLLGHRVRVASRLLGIGLVVATAGAAGFVVDAIWTLPSGSRWYGQALVVAMGLVIVVARPVWNPVGQSFFATLLAAATAYLMFSIDTTLSPGLSVEARLASGVLLVFELLALALSISFTFESCDVLCRVRWPRAITPPDPEYLPMVSIHVAAYNEPPDMLIETIQTLEALDYPNFEVVIVDNNTDDPAVWQPVEEYCRDRPRLRFVHVNPWPGYKSGALNLALRQHTSPDAEIIGLVDADYRVDPAWLRDLVGYLSDPYVAFVQSPQDYREYDGDEYLQACYDAYKYFFVTTMPSRNQRDSIIFAGTMGLLRRVVLEEVGGWDEWCITEDAELSLRILRAGYEGVYVGASYGRGIMPLTFAALKSQRFRWCFGGMQILRMHWRDLLPWRGGRANRLTIPQRIDYLLGSIQWMNDLVYFGFTVVLMASAVVLINDGPLGLRPLYGAAVLLPATLIVSGIVRALWAVRIRTGIGARRSILAFANWLALSWTVALACVQGLTRRQGVFLRTPKSDDGDNRLVAALWAARAETIWAIALWTLAALIVVNGRATAFVLVLFVWQGSVYASAPFMSWLNQHTVLSPQLERRRRTEWLRERSTMLASVSIGAIGGAAVAGAVALLIGFGGSNPGNPPNPFSTPPANAAEEQSPAPTGEPGPTTTATAASSTSSNPTTTTPPTTTAPSTPPPSAPPSTTPPTAPPTTAAPPAT